ncbi:MAG: nuclear transport factor 2 family protein [Thermoanaerobaculia bacterium]|nr:nuclear transport factor 2 family protein [Thermoanaerobaculia bacterium]
MNVPRSSTPDGPTRRQRAHRRYLAALIVPSLCIVVLWLLAPSLLLPGVWAQEEAAVSVTPDADAERRVAGADDASAANEAAAHDALRELRTIYERAVNENRLELLEPHLEDGVVGVMVTGEVVEGFDGLRTYWRNLLDLIGEGGSYTTTLEPQLSWIHGDVAVAKGSTRDVVTIASGKEYHFTSSFTAVLVDHGAQWKIRRMQGTMDPVNNVFVRAKARAATLSAGGAAALAGLTLGWLLGRFGPRGRRAAPTA